MTIGTIALPRYLISTLQAFADEHDFAKLYTQYDWERDNWRAGFPDILRLEKRLANRAKRNLVTKDAVIAVAEWARYRNIKRIHCPDSLGLPFYPRGQTHAPLAGDPATLATQLRQATKGLGPTTLSMVLRFAVPRELGAINTKTVRVVGQGDDASQREDWLSLRVRDYGDGWYIPLPQGAWPEDYSRWISILGFFAASLNEAGVACPHPEGFVTGDLRTRGIWACADVEMALFSWASQSLKGKRSRCSAI